jgi:3-hydroxybutyryl-CoA dehydrogenase
VAERGIADTTDIDLAARLALGYPSGPLELGDELGPELIVEILDGLLRFTGDPRYRTSGWLRMRMECAMPLSSSRVIE